VDGGVLKPCGKPPNDVEMWKMRAAVCRRGSDEDIFINHADEHTTGGNELLVSILEVSVMGQKIGNEKVKREDGYLYYIGKDGYVWAAPMKHNKSGRKKKVGSEKVAKQSGYMYYLGKDGYVYKAKLKNA